MTRIKLHALRIPLLVGVLAAALFLVISGQLNAQPFAEPIVEPSPFHPTFALLDDNGENVLDSGAPISTMETCGECHDTDFIAGHSFHADVGLSAIGETDGLRDWDTSPGLFGRWDPITYRYLSPLGDDDPDLTTAEWIQVYGERHIGGGPAETSRGGDRLAESGFAIDLYIVDPDSGNLVDWDWTESGAVEMNCFLCHLDGPDNNARVAALQAGDFGWANTATLVGSGIVNVADAEYDYSSDAFDDEGNLLSEFMLIQDPDSENCGSCHGLVHTDAQIPLEADTCNPQDTTTLTTGEIFSPQKMANSGLNLVNKEDLNRAWDVHAERVVDCASCHYSLNNPIYYDELDADQPEHLSFDPRRLDLGEYLYRPLHQFAKGQSAQSALAPEYDNTLRRCESCHDASAGHDWLPYPEKHTDALACESCHIPQLYAPALESMDWTVLQDNSTPVTVCRGVEENAGSQGTDLWTGFTPVLLPRENADGSTQLAPHNLVTFWYWVYGDPPRPVPLRDLEAAWFDGDDYALDVLAAFDQDGDGDLSEAELSIDTDEQEALITGRLAARGLDDPRIVGEVDPYTISHNVAGSEWATKNCETCHSEDSRVAEPVLLAANTPGGVLPEFGGGGGTSLRGDVYQGDDGTLFYAPATTPDLYVLGKDNVRWVDWFGIGAFLMQHSSAW